MPRFEIARKELERRADEGQRELGLLFLDGLDAALDFPDVPDEIAEQEVAVGQADGDIVILEWIFPGRRISVCLNPDAMNSETPSFVTYFVREGDEVDWRQEDVGKDNIGEVVGRVLAFIV